MCRGVRITISVMHRGVRNKKLLHREVSESELAQKDLSESSIGGVRIKNGMTQCNSRHLIGFTAMVFEPLYHAGEIAAIKLSSGCSCKAKSARSSNIS